MKSKVSYSKICLTLLIIISGVTMQNLHAEEKSASKEHIELDGPWHLQTRSLPSTPFTASLRGDELTLECTSPNYDISITLTDINGEAVWQRDITASETSFVFIPLDGLPRGSYTLRISNDYGGYLWGTFQL